MPDNSNPKEECPYVHYAPCPHCKRVLKFTFQPDDVGRLMVWPCPIEECQKPFGMIIQFDRTGRTTGTFMADTSILRSDPDRNLIDDLYRNVWEALMDDSGVRKALNKIRAAGYEPCLDLHGALRLVRVEPTVLKRGRKVKAVSVALTPQDESYLRSIEAAFTPNEE